MNVSHAMNSAWSPNGSLTKVSAIGIFLSVFVQKQREFSRHQSVVRSAKFHQPFGLWLDAFYRKLSVDVRVGLDQQNLGIREDLRHRVLSRKWRWTDSKIVETGNCSFQLQVLSRGSQYRVESMMIRLAKCWNFVTVTPDNMQRLHMRAPECIPLTLEPMSTIYFTPVAVLDFQSLYPSIIIAYNLCFSTCLGRIDQLDKQGPFKFGCTSLTVPDQVFTELNLQTDVFCSPNGIAFVNKSIRRGVLPVMLEEILATRIMVKNTMKLIEKKSTLYRTLDARQLCLKLIANVTFGYTSANFSGRMPSVEVSRNTLIQRTLFPVARWHHRSYGSHGSWTGNRLHPNESTFRWPRRLRRHGKATDRVVSHCSQARF